LDLAREPRAFGLQLPALCGQGLGLLGDRLFARGERLLGRLQLCSGFALRFGRSLLKLGGQAGNGRLAAFYLLGQAGKLAALRLECRRALGQRLFTVGQGLLGRRQVAGGGRQARAQGADGGRQLVTFAAQSLDVGFHLGQSPILRRRLVAQAVPLGGQVRELVGLAALFGLEGGEPGAAIGGLLPQRDDRFGLLVGGLLAGEQRFPRLLQVRCGLPSRRFDRGRRRRLLLGELGIARGDRRRIGRSLLRPDRLIPRRQLIGRGHRAAAA
jgi:hypothetical protein